MSQAFDRFKFFFLLNCCLMDFYFWFGTNKKCLRPHSSWDTNRCQHSEFRKRMINFLIFYPITHSKLTDIKVLSHFVHGPMDPPSIHFNYSSNHSENWECFAYSKISFSHCKIHNKNRKDTMKIHFAIFISHISLTRVNDCVTSNYDWWTSWFFGR